MDHAEIERTLMLARHVQASTAVLEGSVLVWQDNFSFREEPDSTRLQGAPEVPAPLQELARKAIAELRSRRQSTLYIRAPGAASAGSPGSRRSSSGRNSTKEKTKRSSMKDAIASLAEANIGLKESSAEVREAALHAVLGREIEEQADSMVAAFVDSISSSARGHEGLPATWKDVIEVFSTARPAKKGAGAARQQRSPWAQSAAPDGAALCNACARLAELYE